MIAESLIAKTTTIRAALGIFARALMVAVPLTGLVATLAAPHIGVAADVLMIPVAWLLAWHHDRLGPLLASAANIIKPTNRGRE